MAFKNWKTTLFIAVYNGRSGISHIVKTQEIILKNLTKYCNDILSYTYGYVGGGGEGWDHPGGWKALFSFRQIFQNILGSRGWWW